MNSLLPYWPTLDHVEQCMRTEAETVGDALLLAVHEPVMLLRRSDQNAQDVPVGEHELLSELMRSVGDGSAVIVAITGASGVGKSHMVRWLRAQLERHPRRGELVVVTIPKTASLRRVVELILEPLPGEAYTRLKQSLSRTADAMSSDKAAALLGAALAEELEPYAKRIEEDLRASRLGRENGPRVTIARHLRTIIRDATVQDNWLREVLLRIVNASLSGTADPADRQFRTMDLQPPSGATVEIEVEEVNRALQFLANAGGKYREIGIEILQEVLDPALRTIFHFTEALQQRTVQEVVDDIRRQLLADNKELVLLIEDLAALSGIQQPLLDIMIAETDSGGVRVRAPIRTAVAVTDGFLASRQTVLTRARGQWVVPSEGMTEQAVVQRLVELTGRYLNAARFGVQRLQVAFQQATDDNSDIYAWVPRFDEAMDVDQLSAFGYSESGYPLFPFNVHAVRSLSGHVLKSGDAWIFNPRSFINEVLRRTLRQREAFTKGKFPPAGYMSPRVPAQVSLGLQYQNHSDAERERLESTLFHWAGNPAQLEGVAPVPRALFGAFGLAWPFAKGLAPPVPPQPPSPPGQPGQDNPPLSLPPAPPHSPEKTLYALTVEEWKPDARMAQAFAHRTRVLLASALHQRLNLSELAVQGLRIEPKLFWLPPENTVSNPEQNQLRVKVAESDVPIPALVRAGLQALDRWEINGKRWDYLDAESDYSQADALLYAIERQLLPLLLEEVEREAAILMSTLHRQSLFAGLGGSAAPDDAPLRLMLAAAPNDPALREDELPTPQRRGLEERRKVLASRVSIQSRLKDCIACFQGTGSKPFAVDPERLKKSWKRKLPERWALGLKLRDDLSPEASDVLERLSPGSVDLVLRWVISVVESLRPAIAAAFGDEHSRIVWREEMKACVERSIQLSLWPTSAREADVRKAIEQLTTETAESAILKVRRMPADDPQRQSMERLAGLGGVPLPQLVLLHQHVTVLEQFLRAQAQLIREQTTFDDEAALQKRESLLQDLTWEE